MPLLWGEASHRMWEEHYLGEHYLQESFFPLNKMTEGKSRIDLPVCTHSLILSIWPSFSLSVWDPPRGRKQIIKTTPNKCLWEV